jgi:ribonuclease P protein component
VLPNAHRLRHWKDFQTVYQKGFRCSGLHLNLRAFRRSPPEMEGGFPTRLGISISRKVSKKAVSRNRIKRQIRVALRQILVDLKPGWDCVIIVKPGIEPCNSLQFLQELKQLFAKAEVLHGHSRGNVL